MTHGQTRGLWTGGFAQCSETSPRPQEGCDGGSTFNSFGRLARRWTLVLGRNKS